MNVLRGNGGGEPCGRRESSRECACALRALSRTPLAHTPQNAQGPVARSIAVAFEAKQFESAREDEERPRSGPVSRRTPPCYQSEREPPPRVPNRRRTREHGRLNRAVYTSRECAECCCGRVVGWSSLLTYLVTFYLLLPPPSPSSSPF